MRRNSLKRTNAWTRVRALKRSIYRYHRHNFVPTNRSLISAPGAARSAFCVRGTCSEQFPAEPLRSSFASSQSSFQTSPPIIGGFFDIIHQWQRSIRIYHDNIFIYRRQLPITSDIISSKDRWWLVEFVILFHYHTESWTLRYVQG